MSTWFNEKWDRRFLDLAEFISRWSKDPSTKVGAVIIDNDDRSTVSTGYNGFPRGFPDDEALLNDREFKYEHIIHGERNAIIYARRDLRNTTLFTWPFMPCASCAGLVVSAGIKDVVAPANDNPRWAKSFERSREVFRRGKVKLWLYDAAGHLLDAPGKGRGPCCDQCHAAADGRDPNDCGGCA